jgi:hypothetical protein
MHPCRVGISGHDRPGQEIIAEGFQVDDGSLHWSVSGRCGFATSFAYSSDFYSLTSFPFWPLPNSSDKLEQNIGLLGTLFYSVSVLYC